MVPDNISPQLAALIRSNPTLHQLIDNWYKHRRSWNHTKGELQKLERHIHRWFEEEGFFLINARRGAAAICRHPCVVKKPEEEFDRQGRLVCFWEPTTPHDEPPNLDNLKPHWRWFHENMEDFR